MPTPERRWPPGSTFTRPRENGISHNRLLTPVRRWSIESNDLRRVLRCIQRFQLTRLRPSVPRGRYRFVAERGKEYFPAELTVDVEQETSDVVLRLERWSNMAQLGWYSGDTHVHRSLDELPNLLLAEDLNVALPLSYWVTEASPTPESGR